MNKRSRAGAWAIAAALFALAWILRAWGTDAFITWDEPAWTYRSARFLLALGDGRLRDTLQTGHPGVLTMWSGALGLLWHRVVTGQVTAEVLRAVQALPELDIHDAETLRLLGGLLPCAKSGTLLAHALLTATTFLLLDRLLPRGAAILTSLLLLLEPYHLALTRVLHIDGLTASLMLISVLALLVWRGDSHRRWVIASGAAMGMAALTKSYAAMATPVCVAALLLATKPSEGQRWLSAAWAALWRWALAALAAFIVLWPAMWVSPARTLWTMFDLAFGYATAPGDATTSFFRGELTDSIGWTFYPAVAYLRTTPTTLVGLAWALGSMLLSLRRPKEERDLGLPESGFRLPFTMLALALVYLALVSLGAKKYDRYVLPALVALDVLAAWGYLALWRALKDRLTRRARRVLAPLAVALVVGTSALWLTPYGPSHYLAHYNALAGGPVGASETLPLGWGEGVEMAADYLASQPDAEDLHVATWAVAGLAPRLNGTVTTLADDHLPAADYVVFTIGDMQSENALALEFAETRPPAYVARIAGQPYAWVYANGYAEDLAARLAAEINLGDMIVTDLPSTLERYHGGSLPIVRIEPGSEAETAAALQSAAETHGAGPNSHLYYLRWIEDERAEPLQRLVEQNGILQYSEPIAYGHLQVYQQASEPTGIRPIVIAPLAEPMPVYGSLTLVGAGLAHDTVRSGQRIGVATEWQTLTLPNEDFQLYLHLLDAAGNKWGQNDLRLADKDGVPTTGWGHDSSHVSRATVPLAAGIVPGEYRLVAGLYRWQDDVALGAPTDLFKVRVLPGGAQTDPTDLGLDASRAIVAAPGIQLLEYRLGADHARTGETVELWLTWRCAQDTAVDWRLDVTLASTDDATTQTFSPAGAAYPTSRWRDGDVLVHPVKLDIIEDLPSGEYAVVGRMTSSDETQRGKELNLGELVVEQVERRYEMPETAFAADALFWDAIGLVGYEYAASSGDSVTVKLYWGSGGQPQTDWTVFIHVLDESGAIVGQVDSQPAQGTRPTSGWLPGEIVWDSAIIPLSEGTPPGEFRVAVGLYDASTGDRAQASHMDGTPIPDNRLVLSKTVTVR